MFFEVYPLHFKDGLLQQFNLIQLVPVHFLEYGMALHVMADLEVKDEVFKGIHYVLGRNISPVY